MASPAARAARRAAAGRRRSGAQAAPLDASTPLAAFPLEGAAEDTPLAAALLSLVLLRSADGTALCQWAYPHLHGRNPSRLLLAADARLSLGARVGDTVQAVAIGGHVPSAAHIRLSLPEGAAGTDPTAVAAEASALFRLLYAGMPVRVRQEIHLPWRGGVLRLCIEEVVTNRADSAATDSDGRAAASAAQDLARSMAKLAVNSPAVHDDADSPSTPAAAAPLPQGFAAPCAGTRISVAIGGKDTAEEQKAQKGGTRVSYSAVGGLETQLKLVREAVELPLRHPERFHQLGIPPPRGLLLVGPPGTGKTLIARAVAAECGAHVVAIGAAEVTSKVYGETEARLQALFAEAEERAPSLIFIDEIDALCPRRDMSASELEKRIVAVMLTLMDGASAAGHRGAVVVLAATNRPDALDPALRRPGRFDREVEIGIPTAPQRRDILRVLLSTVPHCITDEDLDAVADAAHGYVGADLAAVCREAGLALMARTTVDDDARPGALVLTGEDLRHGLSQVRPSGLREVLVEVPRVHWADIGGQQHAKQQLREAVEWPLLHPEAFARMGIRPPRGVLLYGPPGCSKTLMAKALATESGLNFIAIKGPELFSKWVGESEQAVRQVFRKARAASPAVVFFDEIDSIGAQRDGSGGGGSSVADRVLSQLLSEMDGVESLDGVTIVAATNRPDMVDPALLRPGRFDRKVYVAPPDQTAREAILRLQLARMPHTDVDVPALAARCAGFSGAEVVAVCREAALLEMRRDPAGASAISGDALLEAAAAITPNITERMLSFYATYASRGSGGQ